MKKVLFILVFGLMSAQTTESINITKDSKVEVYSALFWSPCKEAKKLLQSRGIDYTTKMITFSRKNTKELMPKPRGKSSLPQIFVDDNHFGGLSELKSYFKQGG